LAYCQDSVVSPWKALSRHALHMIRCGQLSKKPPKKNTCMHFIKCRLSEPCSKSQVCNCCRLLWLSL